MRLELGNDLYPFTHGAGCAKACVIVAHGGWDSWSGEFRVRPGVTPRKALTEGAE
jgi:hypothetical protein